MRHLPRLTRLRRILMDVEIIDPLGDDTRAKEAVFEALGTLEESLRIAFDPHTFEGGDGLCVHCGLVWHHTLHIRPTPPLAIADSEGVPQPVYPSDCGSCGEAMPPDSPRCRICHFQVCDGCLVFHEDNCRR